MAITKEDILEAVGSLTVMELNDLVKAFEEKFGVSLKLLKKNLAFLLLLLQLQVLQVLVQLLLKKKLNLT